MERRDLLKASAALPMSNVLGSLRRGIAPPASPPATASSSSGQVGKIAETLIAQSDANGNITFNVGIVPGGNVWIGGFNCPSAPYTAQFTLTSAGTEVDSWQSSNNPGPIRADSGDTLVITGTGLVANTTYQMFFNGYQTTSGVAPQLVPESHTDVVIATNQGGLQNVETGLSGGATSVVVLPAPKAGFAYRIHSLTMYGQVSVVGNAIGLQAVGLPTGSGLFCVFVAPQANVTFGQNFLLNGQLIAYEITLNGYYVTSLELDLWYDEIQI